MDSIPVNDMPKVAWLANREPAFICAVVGAGSGATGGGAGGAGAAAEGLPGTDFVNGSANYFGAPPMAEGLPGTTLAWRERRGTDLSWQV